MKAKPITLRSARHVIVTTECTWRELWDCLRLAIVVVLVHVSCFVHEQLRLLSTQHAVHLARGIGTGPSLAGAIAT